MVGEAVGPQDPCAVDDGDDADPEPRRQHVLAEARQTERLLPDHLTDPTIACTTIISATGSAIRASRPTSFATYSPSTTSTSKRIAL